MPKMGTMIVSEAVDREMPAVSTAGSRIPILSLLAALWRWFSGRLDKRRSRIVLSELTNDQLRDIGLTRTEATIEAYRSFWD